MQARENLRSQNEDRIILNDKINAVNDELKARGLKLFDRNFSSYFLKFMQTR